MAKAGSINRESAENLAISALAFLHWAIVRRAA